MWNKPTQKQLSKLPGFEQTEEVPTEEIIINMHFFIGGCDWYISEYDPEERTFFGFAILNNDLQNAEWGYISLDELCEIKVSFMEVDHDLHWNVRKAIEVDKIKKAQGW